MALVVAGILASSSGVSAHPKHPHHFWGGGGNVIPVPVYKPVCPTPVYKPYYKPACQTPMYPVYNNYYNTGCQTPAYVPTPVYQPPVCNQRYAVILRNNSSHSLSAAVCWMSGGQWLVKGWWNLDPGQSVNCGRLSHHSKIYFYAESGDGTTWTGDNSTTVTNGAFCFQDGDGDRSVLFQEAYVSPGSNSYTYNFNE